MQRWGRRVVVTLGIWLGSSLVPRVGLAAPGEDARPPKVGEDTTSQRVPGLAVWIEPSVPEGDRIHGWVEERGAEVLRKHEPPLGAEDLVRVEVRGEPYDYRIHVALLRGRKLVSKEPTVVVCECGSDEMLERAGEAIAEGARRLSEAGELRGLEPPPPPSPSPSPLPQVENPQERRRLGAMGYAGIGVSALGVGALVAGIALVSRPVELRGEKGTFTAHSLRPPGVGLAIGGGAALVAGLTLIVLDAERHREPRVAVAPMLEPRLAGLTIARRF